jgi:hypothetical protein
VLVIAPVAIGLLQAYLLGLVVFELNGISFMFF